MANPVRRATKILPATDAAIQEAAEVLRKGGLIVFPTETVYGLGADAENPVAMRALFAAKGRPADHPVIVHLADAEMVALFAAEIPPAAKKLAAAFWPGPMTLILRRGDRISDLVTGGMDTVGLRVPSHPVAQALLKQFGGAIAAPSANRFGRVSPTRAEHVMADLEGRVDLILDGGACDVGLESTILDLSRGQPAILRPGAVTAEQVAAALEVDVTGSSPDSPRVSGSLPSHYAPKARIEIVAADEIARRANELTAQGQRVAVLSTAPPHIKNVVWVLTPVTVEELARQLYSLLRRVDELGCEIALISLPKEHGLGAAIADRLRRAAGPRS